MAPDINTALCSLQRHFCLRYILFQYMALTSGTKLGPYEIIAPIGAGGMGEVYQALDTRLDRNCRHQNRTVASFE
jgi:serine/threonine protein kinase